MPDGILGMVLIYGALFGAMWFFLIRPQKNQQKKTQEMLNQIKRGDKVITIGGLHGVVEEVDATNNTITLDCEGIFLTFERRAISRVVKASTIATEAGIVESDEVLESEDVDQTNE